MFGNSRKRSRLDSWHGARRIPLLGLPVQRWRRRAEWLHRLLVAAVTVLLLSLIAHSSGGDWGLPYGFREGQTHPRDLCAQTGFGIDEELAGKLRRERELGLVGLFKKDFDAGAILVPAGKTLSKLDLQLLRAEHRAVLQSLSWSDHLRRWASLGLVVATLGLFVGWYLTRFAPHLAKSLPRLIGVCGLITVGFLAAIYSSQSPWHATLAPLTVLAMILTLSFDQPFALVVSLCLALVTTLSLGGDLGSFLILVSGLTVSIVGLRRVRGRLQLVQAGLGAGLAYAVMTLAVGILDEQSWNLIASDALRRLCLALAAGFLLSGGLPLIERAFGIVTDISLLELANASHPLLQEMKKCAPGTHTHSMAVATLAESAAEAIGANPLLARVGACFHDIGKMLKPHYFIENQIGENRHNGLAPAMSTLIIIGHVKDGVELAHQHKLPTPIVDFIQQHHGTTLVEYFFREAARNLEPHQGSMELEAAFRYPGPKPQTREIGVVMLADAVESAGRALNDPAPSSLKKLVHDILFKRLFDGQFDESGLTLTELRLIEDSLCKTLIALHHSRVKYPEARTAS